MIRRFRPGVGSKSKSRDYGGFPFQSWVHLNTRSTPCLPQLRLHICRRRVRPTSRSTNRLTGRMWYVPRALDARPASGPGSGSRDAAPLRHRRLTTSLAHRPALEPCTDKLTVNYVCVYSPECPDAQRLCRSSRCRGVELDSKSSRAAVRSGYVWRRPQGRRTYTEMKGVACKSRQAVEVINCSRTSCRACRLQRGLAIYTLVGLRRTHHASHAAGTEGAR